MVCLLSCLFYSNDGKNGLYAATDKGLYRTYDLTKGWEKLPLPAGIDEQIFVVHTDEAQPQTIWAGTSRSSVVVSKDGGLTWQKMTDIPENSTINAIETNPQNPNWVYVGTSQTFYLSRDGGQSWTRRGGNLPIGNYNSILINPNNPNEIIVASAMEGRGGIYHSLDGGNLWKQIDTKDLNLPTRRVWTMAFDPKNSNKILIGTHSSGIYQIERDAIANTGETTSRPRVASNPN
ncbi:MAG TPA: YCF48-related protein [Pyrinomonadaceae bacterium]|nr:YCF48-related protein [Pyrinomonadaceae bacterium]